MTQCLEIIQKGLIFTKSEEIAFLAKNARILTPKITEITVTLIAVIHITDFCPL